MEDESAAQSTPAQQLSPHASAQSQVPQEGRQVAVAENGQGVDQIDNSASSLNASSADLPYRFAPTRTRNPSTLLTRFTSFDSTVARRPRTHARSASASISRGPKSSFNPEAAEFIPSAEMAPKKKVSASTRAGPPVTVTRSTPCVLNNTNHPVILPEEIFGDDALVGNGGSSADHGDNATANGSTDPLLDQVHRADMWASELQAWRPLINAEDQHAIDQRIHEILLSTVRPRTAESTKRKLDQIQNCSSAILYSHSSTHHMSGVSDGSVRLRYLPLAPDTGYCGGSCITKNTNLTILRRVRKRIDATAEEFTAAAAAWPSLNVPVELFELIISFLSRDDVKSMRLVNKEFEQKVSRLLFRTSVVPFNTELYDMIDEESRAVHRSSRSVPRPKGKGKARARDSFGEGVEMFHGGFGWQNAKDDSDGKVYKGHGLRVFKGFGPHIKRFGMSFEVTEAQLARPPVKKELDHVDSYHGSYDWPPKQYTRFANLAGLEQNADETFRMKAAFANLKKVKDLGLSIESGLGWLNGPDKSIRARIFERPPAVFGPSRDVPDRQMQEAQEFWTAIIHSHYSFPMPKNIKELSIVKRIMSKSPTELPGLIGTRYADPTQWPSVAVGRTGSTPPSSAPFGYDQHDGVLYTTSSHLDAARFPVVDKTALVPAELRKEQKEWLLETEWAQRAFLESYMLAVVDNPLAFGGVQTLNIAKISGGFLHLLARESFWDALPSLNNVTILVKPDWRVVEKDNAGIAETCPQNPSDAVRTFHRCILRDRICLRASIAKLNIGWVGGGEHAEGIFARNQSILPAPITDLEDTTNANNKFITLFKFVEHLTLTNCWITPPTLAEVIQKHAGLPMKTLTLNSVSLTAHPRFPAGQQQQQIAQAMAALQGGAGPLQQPFVAAHNNQAHHAAPMMLNTLHYAAAAPQQAPPLAGPAPQNAAVQNHNNNHNNVLHQSHHPAPVESHWTEDHREGSWPELLNKISPGPIFSDYRSAPAPWEPQLPFRIPTNLHTLEFKSCGYARLHNNTAFDQFVLEAHHEHQLSIWFRTRQASLAPAMMTSNDGYLARIVQHIPDREVTALLLAWGLPTGWADYEQAELVEFDGMLPGGTGRFSGKIERNMALVGQSDDQPKLHRARNKYANNNPFTPNDDETSEDENEDEDEDGD